MIKQFQLWIHSWKNWEWGLEDVFYTHVHKHHFQQLKGGGNSVILWLTMEKDNMVYTMKYHSALKRKGILRQTSTRGTVEDRMLSEINPSSKDKCSDSTYMRCRECQTWDRKRNGGSQSLLEREPGSCCLMGLEPQFFKVDCTTVWGCVTTELCT
jgi:hypothetical protein